MNIENNTQRTPFLKCTSHSYKTTLLSIERPLKGFERCNKALEMVHAERGIFFPILIDNYFPMFGKISYTEFLLRLCAEEYRISDNFKLKRWF